MHGDMNPTNILFDGRQLLLTDLEPSLRQMRGRNRVVMSSVGLRSLRDLRNNAITIETDKIGFFLFCRWAFGIPYDIDDPREFGRKRRAGFELLPIKESCFMELEFRDILDVFYAEHLPLYITQCIRPVLA